MRSSPGQELLGVITSHGPCRESYQVNGEASGERLQKRRPPSAVPALSAEGVRKTIPSGAGPAALL